MDNCAAVVHCSGFCCISHVIDLKMLLIGVFDQGKIYNHNWKMHRKLSSILYLPQCFTSISACCPNLCFLCMSVCVPALAAAACCWLMVLSFMLTKGSLPVIFAAAELNLPLQRVILGAFRQRQKCRAFIAQDKNKSFILKI